MRSNRELGWWSNPYVYGGIALVVLLQMAFIVAPFVHEVVHASALDPDRGSNAVSGGLAGRDRLPADAADQLPPPLSGGIGMP